ncbi:hypothetical protein WA158_000589 [Blastocystis sp. Blastoise]
MHSGFRNNDFKLLEILGKGLLGTTYRARHKTTNKLYSIRVINATGDLQGVCEDFLYLTSITSHFVSPIVDCFCSGDGIWIVSEFVNGVSLNEKLFSSEKPLTEQQIQLILLACLLGLKKLHDNNIPYFNLKPQNILCTNDGIIKLTGYGIPYEMYQDLCGISFSFDSLPYLSPQMIQFHQYQKADDIWSLGIILFFLIEKQLPFEDIKDEVELSHKIINTKQYILHNNSFYSKELIQLVNSLLSYNISDRPTIHTILQMPYIKSITNTIKSTNLTFFDNPFSPFLLSPASPRQDSTEYCASEYFAGSQLLTDYYCQYILSWLGNNNKHSLLYKATRDGFSSSAFHSRCDNIPGTIVIIKTVNKNNHIYNLFGGYTSLSWFSPNDDILYGQFDPNSFLFTLKNSFNIPPTRFFPNNDNWSIVNSKNSHIQFGYDGKDSRDLYIANNSNENNDSFTSFNGNIGFFNTTNKGCSLFVNTNNEINKNYFVVEEIEVYH